MDKQATNEIEALAERLNACLRAGGRVQVTTYARSTIYGRRNAGAFTVGADGCLYVQHGRSKLCLSMANGTLLVGIQRHERKTR